jgi:hypothetical protein
MKTINNYPGFVCSIRLFCFVMIGCKNQSETSKTALNREDAIAFTGIKMISFTQYAIAGNRPGKTK